MAGLPNEVGQGEEVFALGHIRPQRWTAQFTTELLELLWVLEATLAVYPQQGRLMDQVLDGPLFQASELPSVPDAARKAPGVAEPNLFEQPYESDD